MNPLDAAVLVAALAAISLPVIAAWVRHRDRPRTRARLDRYGPMRCTARWKSGLISSDIPEGSRCMLTAGHDGEHKPERRSRWARPVPMPDPPESRKS